MEGLGTTPVQSKRLLQEGEKFDGDVITGLVDTGENFMVSGKLTPDQAMELENKTSLTNLKQEYLTAISNPG